MNVLFPDKKFSNLRLVTGTLTLDGSGATSVATGLSNVLSAGATLKGSSAPGDNTHALSVDYGGSVEAGQLDVYPWKPTSGSDPTLVASDGTETVDWFAVGN